MFDKKWMYKHRHKFSKYKGSYKRIIDYENTIKKHPFGC